MATGQHSVTAYKLSAEQANLVRSALESLVSSDAFAPSKRCQDFLRLVVEHALAGELDSLSERMIGAEMFRRPVDYDTSNDAVVRVRATEVRKRLAQYYREAAQTPVVRIDILPGSYVLEFHWSSPGKIADQVTAPVPSQAIASRSRRTLSLAVTAVLVCASLLAIIWLQSRTKVQSNNTLRLSLGLPKGVNLHRNWHPFEHIAVSPDGQTLAFAATDASGRSFLWIRALSSPEAQRIEQTEGALLPFWSPDSQFIGFWAGAKLKKVQRSGGVPEVIYTVPEIAQGAWGLDGTILFARAVNSPILRISPTDGTVIPVTSLLPGQVSQMWVQFLPDGKHFIYLARTSLTSSDPGAKIYTQSLDGGDPILLLANQSRAIAVPDYLLFAQDRNLL